MSPDELLVLAASFAFAIPRWWDWSLGVKGLLRRRGDTTALAALVLGPSLSLLLLVIGLRMAAAADVRNSTGYLVLYMVLGAAWLSAGVGASTWLGLDARYDVAELGNPAAACALFGMMLGLTGCYAGGNIGDGPGWWIVVFCGLLATTGWLLLWLCVEQFGSVSEAITIDRDVASGIRLGGMLTAAGLILGRAVAGNWMSLRTTVVDFGIAGWFAAIPCVSEVAVAKLARPGVDRPARSVLLAGLLPAAAYVGAAIAWVVSRGPW